MTCPTGCRSSEKIWSVNVSLTEPRGKPCAEGSRHLSSSHELPMESRAIVEPGPGKKSVFTHFPKDPNCDICLKTKITRASCRGRAGYSRPQSGQFDDLITAEVNHATIIDTPLWYKLWQLSGSNLTHAKQKLLKRPRRA